MTNKYVQRKTVRISVCLHNKRTTYYQRNNNIRAVSKGHDMSAAVSERPPPPLFEGPPMEEDSALRLHMMNAEGEGATPLMYACQQGRDADLRSIIAKKPSAVRERDRTLKTALHYCAENSSLICAETILSTAPDMIDAKDEDGYTALHLAVIAGNTPLLKLLLSKGADVNCLDNEGHSAVHWATVCGELEALENVLASGATASTPDMHGGYPLHYAAQMCGPTSDRDGILRIGLAVLRTLLNHGVEVNATDQDGRQPILWAASAGSADAILALVNAGASVEADDKDGLTALHCAASRGHTDCLETLLSLCGASVDVMDSNGCTALFYAVTLGHADATQLLLEHGAQPNRQDRKGRTPAHCGAAKGQLETLRLLSGRGANMWARNVKGDYPLHEAVSSGRKDLVRWLLSQRPDAVNASNNDGRCPLHIAAINNNVEICKILLDSESLVNPVMRTSKGQMMTPLDAALHKGNRGCAKYLQLHGGVPATKLTSHSAALRGAKHRLEPHSDQITTPDWGPSLPVPEMRVSQSLVPSPVELNGHKHLTVVDANSRTFEVHVEDEIHRSDRRPFSDSSIEERARRRRRKRRPRREEESEKESDSDERRRRRRRRRKEREDSSEEESELERRRRRRKSQRGKYSDDSDSDDKEKRKRKESKSQQKKQASKGRNDKEDESKEDQTKYNTENQREDNSENKDDPINVHEIPTESRKFITEEIKTREVVKSKKVIEKKEKEKSSEKPNVSKSSKITSEEKKIEEQITKKTSEFIQSVPKDSDVLSRDVDDSTIQQVVTAIVHQEDGESKPTEEATQGIDPKEKETTGNDIIEEGEGQRRLTETLSNEEGEEDIKDGSKALGKPEENSNADNIETKICVNEDKENKELLKDDDFWGNEENEAEQSPKMNANQIELDASDARNADVNETCSENIDGPKVENNDQEENMLGIPNDVQNEFSKNGEINANDEDDRIQQENIDHKEDKAIPEDQKTIESEIHLIHTYDKIEEGIYSKEDHVVKDEDDKECMTKEDNEIGLQSSEMVDEDKGLIKVYGQSEMSNEEMKGKLTLEDVSYVRRDRGRTRERGRQSRSSFEVVSPAHSAPEDDRDSETANSRNGADSSQLQDSGFEPSPRRDKHMMKRDASRIPRACRRPASQHPTNEVPEEQPSISSTVSVTQAVQNSMRKYHLERRIFHELLELKRLQIRAGRANEALLVKRLADDYRRAGLLIGLKQYNGEYNFRSFEKFLYDQLRLLQNSDRRLIPRLKPTDDLEKLTKALRRTRAGSTLLDNVPENPIFCTYGTHRCYHATHAYTGVPCAAYITRLNHHTVPKPGSQSGFLPRIDSGIRRAEGQGSEIAKCLRYVDPSRPVTLELSHGSEKQVISLPTEKLDKNKRYYVTFTIKGGESKQPDSDKHQHAKSF